MILIIWNFISNPSIIQALKGVAEDFNFDKIQLQFSPINANKINFQPYTFRRQQKLLIETAKMMNIEFDIEKADSIK